MKAKASIGRRKRSGPQGSLGWGEKIKPDEANSYIQVLRESDASEKEEN